MSQNRYPLPEAPDGVTPVEALELAVSLLGWAESEGAADPEHLPLAFPVVVRSKGGDIVSETREVSVRRPKVKDLSAVANAKSDTAAGIELGRRLTGLPQHIFESLDATDFERIGEVIAGFQTRSPATGSPAE